MSLIGVLVHSNPSQATKYRFPPIFPKSMYLTIPLQVNARDPITVKFLLCKDCFQIVRSEVGLVATKKITKILQKIGSFRAEWADDNLIINNCIKSRVSPKTIDFQPDTAYFCSTLVNFLSRLFEGKFISKCPKRVICQKKSGTIVIV